MKTLCLLPAFLAFVFTNFNDSGQSIPGTTGLYSSLADFRQHKLTYLMDCNDRENKLKLNGFFEGSTGYVIYKGEKHPFDKNQFYGFQSCDNKNYRFYKNSIYQIMDTAGFYIYYQFRSEELTKGKGPVKVDKYFFSRAGSDALQILTIANLKEAYPTNSRFQYDLDYLCRSDRDLLDYDKMQHMYKIEYLYTQSLK